LDALNIPANTVLGASNGGPTRKTPVDDSTGVHAASTHDEDYW
jgi:hypothetical protein